MAYVVIAVYEFDNTAYGNDLLGVVDSSAEAFSLIKKFDHKKEFVDMAVEGTSIIWDDYASKEFGTNGRTGQAFYMETYYTNANSDICGSVTFTIYEIKGVITPK